MLNFFSYVFLAKAVLAINYSTYPAVPKSASINGFADPIYSLLPSCAQSCVDVSTSSTPCPYWDTGCLCVMPQWSGVVAECFAESCDASEVATATYLAYSLCLSVGADLWMMPASISTMLSSAASGVVYDGSAGSASATAGSSAGSSVSQSPAITAAANGTSSSTDSSSATDLASLSALTLSSANGVGSLAVQITPLMFAAVLCAL